MDFALHPLVYAAAYGWGAAIPIAFTLKHILNERRRKGKEGGKVTQAQIRAAEREIRKKARAQAQAKPSDSMIGRFKAGWASGRGKPKEKGPRPRSQRL